MSGLLGCGALFHGRWQAPHTKSGRKGWKFLPWPSPSSRSKCIPPVRISLAHQVLGLCKLSRRLRPPRFALNLCLCLNTSFSHSHMRPPAHSTGSGNKKCIHTQGRSAIPTPAVSTVSFRAQVWDGDQDGVATAQLRGQLSFPTGAGSLFVLVQQRSSFISECPTTKQNKTKHTKPPIMLADACLSLGFPQNKTSGRDLGLGHRSPFFKIIFYF